MILPVCYSYAVLTPSCQLDFYFNVFVVLFVLGSLFFFGYQFGLVSSAFKKIEDDLKNFEGFGKFRRGGK